VAWALQLSGLYMLTQKLKGFSETGEIMVVDIDVVVENHV
jgi:hypothetical protein